MPELRDRDYYPQQPAYIHHPRRPCNDKRCPNMGALYHMAHSPCRVKDCVDWRLSHTGPHWIRREQQP